MPTVRGPIFSGATDAVIVQSCGVIQEQVAAQASADVHLWMNHFFQHPTPYYETQVIVENRGESTVVTDQGIVYGPWLAGLGERNKTSRFKGYAHWRLAVQGARARASEIAAVVLRAVGI